MSWLKEHWKPLAVLAGFLLVFSLGRYSAPSQETKVESEVLTKTLVVTKTVIRRDEQKTRVVYREKVTLPNGTITERESEKEESKATTVISDGSTSTSESQATTEVSSTSVTPQWRVGALVGAQFSLSPSLTLAPAFGASVERRLVGPVFVGLWGLSTGAAGLSISLEF